MNKTYNVDIGFLHVLYRILHNFPYFAKKVINGKNAIRYFSIEHNICNEYGSRYYMGYVIAIFLTFIDFEVFVNLCKIKISQ